MSYYTFSLSIDVEWLGVSEHKFENESRLTVVSFLIATFWRTWMMTNVFAQKEHKLNKRIHIKSDDNDLQQ